MVTEPRHFHIGQLTGLNKGHGPVNFDFFIVDDDFFQICHRSHFALASAPEGRFFVGSINAAVIWRQI